jgi:hypothetical protein
VRPPRLKWALLGGGSQSLIGRVHRIAAEMGDDYRLIGGVFSSHVERSRQHATELGLDPKRTYAGIDEFLAGELTLPADERVRVATIATPNHLHFEMASKLIEAGFHVICEKPVTTSVAEAEAIAASLRSRSLVFAVTHTYTGYAMVRQMRAMISSGAIGAIQRVDAQYYQGWVNAILHDPERRRSVWRLDPKQSGPSSCVADIGVHAFNLIEYTTGLKIREVLADTETVYADNVMDVDASILVRTEHAAKGVVRVSQIATAEANNLQIMVYGRKGALRWAQEEPNRLELLEEGRPMSVIKPGYPFNAPQARDATHLPPGHPEGLIEAMGVLYRGVARAINEGRAEPGLYPGIEDGVRGMRFIEAVLDSARRGSVWVNL